LAQVVLVVLVLLFPAVERLLFLEVFLLLAVVMVQLQALLLVQVALVEALALQLLPYLGRLGKALSTKETKVELVQQLRVVKLVVAEVLEHGVDITITVLVTAVQGLRL
jgi:hypothetical protein